MVKITWYEGGRSEETPRQIYVDGQVYDIDEVLERALIFDAEKQVYRQKIRVHCKLNRDKIRIINVDNDPASKEVVCYGTFCVIGESNKWSCREEK